MQQRVSGNCVLPLAFWASQPPTHDVTCLLATPDGHCILTGDTEGKIIVWVTGNVSSDDIQIYSKWMLLCHRNPIVGMAMAGGGKESLRPYVVSLSEIGDMALWDIEEGRCVEYVRDSRYLHTQVLGCEVEGQIYNRVYCCGRYPEIVVYDALHLELLFTLVSQAPFTDWYTSLTIFRHAEQKNDVILSVSLSGTVTMWTINPNDKLRGHILAEESKFIGCSNTLAICCCPSSPRSVLVVCHYIWKIYDAMDWTVLTTQKCNQSEPFIGGEFISTDSVVLYSRSGRAFVYKLPPSSLRGRVSFARFTSPTALFRRDSTSQNNPSLMCIFEMPNAWKCSSLSLHLRSKVFLWYHYVSGSETSKNKSNPPASVLSRFIGANARGDLLFYTLPTSMDSHNQSRGNVSILPSRIHCLQDYWREELTGDLLSPFAHSDPKASTSGSQRLVLTSACYIQNNGKLALGLNTGEIILVPLVNLLTSLCFTESVETPEHIRLIGHQGVVTCILHPNSTNLSGHSGNPNHPFASYHSDVPEVQSTMSVPPNLSSLSPQSNYNPLSVSFKPLYDPDVLLSGSVDCSVRIWNINSGQQLAVFHAHAGAIISLNTVPMRAGTPSRATGCVVSVGQDNSVSIFSLRERKMVLHCAHQTSPILCLGWRALDDFLLISCLDGSLYVWEIGSGYLDRLENGQQAEDVFDNCPVYTRIRNPRGNLLLPHLKLTRGNHRESRFRSLILPPTRLLCSAFAPYPVHNISPESGDQMTATFPHDPISTFSHHVLCFDVESLVEDLLGQDWRQRHSLSQNAGAPFSSNVNLSVMTSPLINSKTKRNLSSSNLSALPQLSKENDFSGKLNDTIDGNVFAVDSLELNQQVIYLLCCLLHPWTLDSGVDRALRDTLGFLTPRYLNSSSTIHRQSSQASPSPQLSSAFRPHWGLLSRHNALALLLPGWHKLGLPRSGAGVFSRQTVEQDWNIGRCMSTVRLTSAMTLVQCMLNISDESLARWETNCLIQTLSKDIGNKKSDGTTDKDHGHHSLQRSFVNRKHSGSSDGAISKKQVLTLMATTLCTTLPDALEERRLKEALVQLLAYKWQDRCLQVREACQTLLHALLDRVGGSERNYIVQRWTKFLPPFSATDFPLLQQGVPSLPSAQEQMEMNPREEADQLSISMFGNFDGAETGILLLDLDWWIPSVAHKLSLSELHRLQGLAIVLLGVMGARYGASATLKRTSFSKTPSVQANGSVDGDHSHHSPTSNSPIHAIRTQSSVVLEGFGVDNYHVARRTCRALTLLAHRTGETTITSNVGFNSQQSTSNTSSSINQTVTMSSLHLSQHAASTGSITSSPNHHPSVQQQQQNSAMAFASNEVLWHGPMRRIAMDLLGRGFAVWEPYLDVALLLNTLLFSAKDVENLLESLEAGATIPDHIDAAHIARQALLSIAQARPKAFVVTLSREVLRFNNSGAAGSLPASSGGGSGVIANSSNTLMVGGIAYPPLSDENNIVAANAGSGSSGTSSGLSGSVMGLAAGNSLAAQIPVFASRSEIWRCIEILLEKRTQELMDVLIEVVDILLFCVDKLRLRERGLLELCPFLKKLSVISSNLRSQKVIVGGKNGTVAFYDFKVGKYHITQGHRNHITAVSFNQDGKLAASYSVNDSQLKIWQLTSSGLFGVGGHHVKLLANYTLPPIGGAPGLDATPSDGCVSQQPHRRPDGHSTGIATPLWLEWSDLRTVQLMGPGGVLSKTKL